MLLNINVLGNGISIALSEARQEKRIDSRQKIIRRKYED
jgi:hypothetical protein